MRTMLCFLLLSNAAWGACGVHTVQLDTFDEPQTLEFSILVDPTYTQPPTVIQQPPIFERHVSVNPPAPPVQPAPAPQPVQPAPVVPAPGNVEKDTIKDWTPDDWSSFLQNFLIPLITMLVGLFGGGMGVRLRDRWNEKRASQAEQEEHARNTLARLAAMVEAVHGIVNPPQADTDSTES